MPKADLYARRPDGSTTDTWIWNELMGDDDLPDAYQSDLSERATPKMAERYAVLSFGTLDRLRALGGLGSGNFGHSGRPGEIGGSAPDGGAGGGGLSSSLDKKYGEIVEAPVHKVKDIATAVELLQKGEYVELESITKVNTLLGELARIANEATALGKDAPEYDLCKVSVPNTNLFCGSAVKTRVFPNGVPRLSMPQIGGKPRPGSEADKLPKDKNGEVSGADAFEAHLRGVGIGVGQTESVLANSLKASQHELIGTKVGGMMSNAGYDPGKKPIFVSSDGYVIDGHHRWAAVVGRDAANGKLGELKMNVKVIDMPITKVMQLADLWAQEFGILPKQAKKKS